MTGRGTWLAYPLRREGMAMNTEQTPILTEGERKALQQKEALQKANQVRSERAHIRKSIASGEVHYADVLMDPPEIIKAVTVHNWLQWISGISKKRSIVIRRTLMMSETVTVGSLSEGSRERLLGAIRHYKPNYDTQLVAA